MPISAIAVQTMINRQLPLSKDLLATEEGPQTRQNRGLLPFISGLINSFAYPLQQIRSLTKGSPLQRLVVNAADPDPKIERQYEEAEMHRAFHAAQSAVRIQREIQAEQDARERQHLEAERTQQIQLAKEAIEATKEHRAKANYYERNPQR